MLKEVSLAEALERYTRGEVVYLIDEERVTTLQRIVSLGFRCLVEERTAEGKGEEERSKEESEQEPKKRRKIDKGKVMALWDAGWKMPEIAEEMGEESKTIYQIIQRELKKRKAGEK